MKNKKIFIDTNIFIRFLTKDHKEKFLKCKEFLSNSIEDSRKEICTSDAVLFEIHWVLKRIYDLENSEIETKITTIVNFCNIVSPNNTFSWSKWFSLQTSKNIDLIDVFNYLLIKQENIDELISYDKDFDKFEDVRRVEP
ncbi:MAG: type II toxin-antitoxin system VapC family toxin [Candidatus Magasanikbacteria bacterium]